MELLNTPGVAQQQFNAITLQESNQKTSPPDL
jgi:hypothetical protein